MPLPKLTLELQPMEPPKRGPTDANGPPTLELVPAGPAGAAALSAAAEIDILPLSTKRVVPPAPTEKPDRFMAEAAHQYAEGHLDQPLWDRAFAQANGDKEAAVAAYLQGPRDRPQAARPREEGRKSSTSRRGRSTRNSNPQ